MKVLTEPLLELNSFREAQSILKNKGKSPLISGCADSQKWNLAYALSEPFKNKVIVTYSDVRMKEIYEDYRMYDKNVRYYPAKDVIFYQADVHGNKLVKDRIGCLKRILKGLPCTFITTFGGLMNVQADIELIKSSLLRVSTGKEIDEKTLAAKLTALGYEKSYQVERGGQFSVRGGIVDIFDLTEDNPYRIELWGDEVSSIRSFDVESQRSVDRLESIVIYPATELPLTEDELLGGLNAISEDARWASKLFREQGKPEEAHRIEVMEAQVREQITELPWTFNADGYLGYFCKEKLSLCDYLEDALFIIDEPARINEHADAVELEFRESMKARLSKGYMLAKQTDVLFAKEEIQSKLSKGYVLQLSTMPFAGKLMDNTVNLSVLARSIPSYNNSFNDLLRDLCNYQKRGFRVLLLSGSRTRAERLAGNINENGCLAFFSDNREKVINPGEIVTMYGHVLKGFEYPELKFVVLSETDIFGAQRAKKRKKHEEGAKIQDIGDLHIGDYVVHESFGIGVYRGIEKVEVDHISKDYMRVEYRDGGVLYVPATNLNAIMKYASADAKKPKINKLGTTEWTKTTSKVKAAVYDVAEELVSLYATRQQREGHVFSEDTIWQKEFEELFPYEETADQLEAIEATKKDMESHKIMDRLICGDVGFGKTEVAIRAAFKAIQDGKQVAFLVPTTILAQQHYNTFVERMKDFPVRVELLSRFVTKKEQDKTIENLKKGLVDIVIGTHRLLSQDIGFKDLGLLIVDEEQRFGVTHKEKIKQLRNDVDVLTLTATPIPRTLHMSLIGIRDMSILEEAPNDRLPIQTYVMEYNEEMVREAINRELSRNGQVYYVYNRVNNIADIAARISALVPEANVAFAHGQMKEAELERIMYDFIRGDIDVLVATTIIETGIDIPNVNTMIIHDSDNLGLSQLYQLRGRVGRSNRTAYAFLMYRRDKILEEVAEKRLETIREFTDLGSGYKIAMRDLEIRGAGNILGMSQHGHMASVGYDLYCKMLNQAVMAKKGEGYEEDFATTIDLDVDAFIPEAYIPNEVLKLDTYRKIAALGNEEEARDMKDELIDRFGEVPDSCENLLKVSVLRQKAHRLYISDIKGKNGEIVFTYRKDAKIKTDGIDKLLRKYPKKLSLYAKGDPTFTYSYHPTGEVSGDERLLLENTETILADMWAYLLD